MALLYKCARPLYGVWKIEETSVELLEKLEHKERYITFLAQVSQERRRQEFLASRLLLRELLGKEEEISYRLSGAPYLVSRSFHISISHTNGFVAVILGDTPVGIDIEYRSDRVRKIRSRFMTQEEEKELDLNHELEHLLVHWCAKVTLFKVIDQEGVDFQKHLHVLPFHFKERRGCFTVKETKTDRSNSYEFVYEVSDSYVLTRTK